MLDEEGLDLPSPMLDDYQVYTKPETDCFPWFVDVCNSSEKQDTNIVLTQRSPLGKPVFPYMVKGERHNSRETLERSLDRYIPRRQETCITGLSTLENQSDTSDIEHPISQISTPYLKKQAFGKILKAQFLPLDIKETINSIGTAEIWPRSK